MTGSLTIVGTGLRFGSDLSLGARACIEQADTVLYGVDDVATVEWLKRLNPQAVNLVAMTEAGDDRFAAYERAVEALVEPARRGKQVCGVFYGHPGYYVYPSHVAIERARAEGLDARMLPGISALDWLFADLGIDPSTRGGVRIHGATEWLLRRRPHDPTTDLILMQVGLIHVTQWRTERRWDASCVQMLTDALLQEFGAEHTCFTYVGSSYWSVPPRIEEVALVDLPQAEIVPETTVFVPQSRPPDVDEQARDRIAAARARVS